ncbi:MAG: ABC transporter permease [Actinomycetaceae bacterium]|nr:ABC transporter permease [Actinomycetaceae bacterium]
MPAGVALLFLIVPFIGMFSQVQWSALGELLTGEAARDAIWLSLRTTITATLISLLLGVPLAHVLAQTNSKQSRHQVLGRVLRVLITLPMVIPPVVAGLALLITFGRRGLIGSYLHVMGIEIGFTTTAVVLAQVFVSMPFLVVSLEGALRTRGLDLEEAAQNLGASKSRVFIEITLPLTLPAIASGTALTFARALGEFGATITFAGSLQGVTRTLPLEIYLQREIDTPTALALATVLLFVAALVIAITGLMASVTNSRMNGHSTRRGDETDELSKLEVVCELKELDALESEWARADEGVLVDAVVKERGVQVATALKRGFMTALVGPNGSGKSTTIELIAGNLQQTSGTVELRLNSDRPTIVWLEQRSLLFPHMSVLDNVAFGPRTRGASRQSARERALRELEAVGCLEFKDRLPGQLSGGQAQRVAIARALAVNPDLILLDEPFAALDFEVAWMLRLILRKRIREAGATAVMVTHDLTDAAFMSDQIVVLEDGRVSESGFTSTVLRRPTSDFLISLTGANRVLTGSGTAVIRPENLSLLPADEPESSLSGGLGVVGGGHQVLGGVVQQLAITPSGEIAVVRLDSGEQIAVTVNPYNRDQMHAGNRVRLLVDDRAYEVPATV